MFTENTAQFFTEFGVSATFGSDTGLVLFDTPEQIVAGGDVISAEYKITYRSALFAALKYNDTITVNGTSYRVNTVQAIQDGALKEAILSQS